jgi:hypothetical protein
VDDRDGEGRPADDVKPPPRSRLEDEVLEILVRADQPTSLADHVRRRTSGRPRVQRAPRMASLPSIQSLDPVWFWVGSVATAVLAAGVRSTSPLLAMLLGLTSAFVFAMIWLAGRGAGSGPGSKRWRGRRLDEPPRAAVWVDALRDRFRRPPRR